MNTFFTTSLAHVINAYLKLDAETPSRLRKLNHRVITVELLPLHLLFHCEFDETRINILSHCDHADAKITGTPLQMLGVMINKQGRQQAFSDDLTITGDAEVANEMIKLFDDMQIDWEEHLAKITGDVPAHFAGRLFQSANKFLRQAKESLTQNINEYVHEEKEWLPSRLQLEDLFADIDLIRMDVDRAEVRVNQLHKKCDLLMEGFNHDAEKNEGQL